MPEIVLGLAAVVITVALTLLFRSLSRKRKESESR
jgi:hypothetical protein